MCRTFSPKLVTIQLFPSVFFLPEGVMERDRYMSPIEAQDFGIIDRVLVHPPQAGQDDPELVQKESPTAICPSPASQTSATEQSLPSSYKPEPWPQTTRKQSHTQSQAILYLLPTYRHFCRSEWIGQVQAICWCPVNPNVSEWILIWEMLQRSLPEGKVELLLYCLYLSNPLIYRSALGG